jgi:parallel beta-helix repeat protein
MPAPPTRWIRRTAPVRVALLAAAIVVEPLAASAKVSAHAAAVPTTRYVAVNGSDSGNDVNDCINAATPCRTIQHAVDEANHEDTVSVGKGTYDESVLITISLTITGAVAGPTTVAGDGSDPSLQVQSGADSTLPTVSLDRLTLSGNTSDPGLIAEDGSTVHVEHSAVDNNVSDGIAAEDSSVITVSHSRIESNASDGIDLIAGAAATVTDSTISGNGEYGVLQRSDVPPPATPRTVSDTASVTISGSTVSSNKTGGIVLDAASSTHISRTTIDGNTGAGVAVDGGGTVTVSDSTVAHTVPYNVGEPAGGGLLDLDGSLTATDDTVFANTNFGIAAGSTATIHVTVENSTVTATKKGTESTYVGGLAIAGSAGTLTVAGTLDAANQTSDCGAHITDAGYNLTSDRTCGLHAKGSRPHAPARLGPLAHNGGPTETVLPGVRSAARNAIPFGQAGCVKGATDQRGQARRSPSNGRCDIGAVEVKVVSPKLHARVMGTKHHGTYSGPVTVTYRCSRGTAALTHKCPKSTHLRAKGRHHVTKTIRALDGGSATVKLTIRIS